MAMAAGRIADGGRYRFRSANGAPPAPCGIFHRVSIDLHDASPDPGARCPLCEDMRQHRLVEEIPNRVLREILAADWGIRIPEAIALRNAPEAACRLLECSSCGLRFFARAKAGDAGYYGALSVAAKYYTPTRWEFGWVKRRLQPGASILDVGCGPGKFLSEIAAVASRAVGLETNASVVEDACRNGLEVYLGELGTFAPENAGKFDVACAFHVLEHVEAPVAFLRSLASCVRPGGTVYLSVPNRERSEKAPVEPLDCPPHHLHRWGSEQLRVVGRISGIPLREIAFEPVDIRVPRDRLRAAVTRSLGRIPFAGDFFSLWTGRFLWRLILSPPLWKLYCRRGILERMGYFGHSVLAAFSCPE